MNEETLRKIIREELQGLTDKVNGLSVDVRATRADIRSLRKDIKNIHSDLIAHDERANEMIIRIQDLEARRQPA